MVFDVEALNQEEMVATKVIVETLRCTHPKLPCSDCPCYKICQFLLEVRDKCLAVYNEAVL